jgi:voltage-gated potassium channel
MIDPRNLPNDLTARRAGRAIAVTTLVIAIAGGLLMRVTDAGDFPTLGSGLWWAVQTITTVGYGDHVPSSDTGKAVAAVVMVTGIGFLSVVTASISAAFVEAARRRAGRQSDDVLIEMAARLERMERRLDALGAPPAEGD